MAKAIITFKIMPDSVEADMDKLTSDALAKVTAAYGDTETKTEIEPVAFGLKALKLIFVMDESDGSPDSLEKEINDMDGVMSCETVDVRRALG